MIGRNAVMISSLLLSFSGSPAAEEFEIDGGDWPMLAHDPGRSGFTSAFIDPPVSRVWTRYFHREGVNSCAQPVVARGRVFLGTLSGQLYCLDVESGRNNWVVQLGTPVFHSACVSGAGVVVVGGGDGRIHALNVTNGLPAWTVPTGAPIWNAPVAQGSHVFIAGRDRHVYGIDASSGRVLWKTDAGAPMLQSLALDIRKQRIYVTTEAMILVALDAGSGKIAWRSSRLPGVSARDQHPVILQDGGILVNTIPFRAGSLDDGPLDDDPLAKGARSRSLFIFEFDGKRREVKFPTPYAGFNKSATAMPIVSNDGKVFVRTWSSPGIDGRPRSIRSFQMDTRSGMLSSERFSAVLLADAGRLTGSGPYLLQTSSRHGERLSHVNRRTGNSGLYYETIANWYGVGVMERLLRAETDKIDYGQEDVPPFVSVGGDLDGGLPLTAGASVVVASKHILWLSGNKLLALRSTKRRPKFLKLPHREDFGIEALGPLEAKILNDSWPINWDRISLDEESSRNLHLPPELKYPPGSRQDPDEKLARASQHIPPDELDKFLWEALQPGSSTGALFASLRGKLRLAIEELIAEKSWMPLRWPCGQTSAASPTYFDDPSDTLLALALSYPFLNEELRRMAKLYVRKSWDGGKLLTTELRRPEEQGKPRERYQVPIAARAKNREPGLVRGLGIERAYAAWAWAHYADDWTRIRGIWPQLKNSALWGASSLEVDALNARAAGWLALLRISNELGDEAFSTRAFANARENFIERNRHERRYHLGWVEAPQIGTTWGYVRWTYLTPELGRFLATHSAVARDLVRSVFDDRRPYWFLADGPNHPPSGGRSRVLPLNSMSAFAAKVFIDTPTKKQIAQYVDLPVCSADLYYIQKLASALMLLSDPSWVSVR